MKRSPSSARRAGKWSSPLRRKEIRAGYLFILPGFLGFALFTAYPMISGMVLSLMENATLTKYVFVGLENYREMFRDEYVIRALTNNVKYAVMQVPATIVLSLFFSVLVFNLRHLRNFFRNVLFLPHITSTLAIATVWKVLFLPDQGLINTMLRAIGIADPPRWLLSMEWALPATVIVAVWQSIGFTMLLFIAGLQSIPGGYYEAAELDGASRFKQFFYITFPLLSPTIFFVTITNIISSFKVFDIVLQMTNGGPANSTNVLVYLIYEEGITNLHFGYSSAIAMLLFVIILAVTFVQFTLRRKWVYSGEE